MLNEVVFENWIELILSRAIIIVCFEDKLWWGSSVFFLIGSFIVARGLKDSDLYFVVVRGLKTSWNRDLWFFEIWKYMSFLALDGIC